VPDFITWVEIRGALGPFFLTDNEVCATSCSLKSEFKGYKELNQILEHEAIIKFFKLPRKGFVVKCVPDFWNLKKIHPNIAEKLKNFYHNFGYLLKNGLFTIEQLFYVYESLPKRESMWESLRVKFWEQILSQNVTLRQITFFYEYNFMPDRRNMNLSDGNKLEVAEKILSMIDTEIKSLHASFLSAGKRKSTNEKRPTVYLWGLSLIERSFPNYHPIIQRVASIRRNYNNVVVLANKKR